MILIYMAHTEQIISGNLLLWTDCEFTGLPLLEGHKIIEIGTIVTDLALNEIDSYESFVKYDPVVVEGLMAKNPWWSEHSQDIPRMLAGITTAKLPDEVDKDLAYIVDSYFKDEKPALCGNSVHSDKTHIDVEFKDFASRLNYQIIDVSSLKLVLKKYLGIEYTDKKHLHYALSDIRESIDEMRFILGKLGIKNFDDVR